MARKSSYDTIEKDPATGFTVSYAKGDQVKISNGTATVVVHKPQTADSRSGGAYQQGMFQFSGSGTELLTYADMVAVFGLIENAVETLNAEPDEYGAKIDRAAPSSYETGEWHELPAKETRKAIKAKDLVRGHIYRDANGKDWIWLGKGDMTRSAFPGRKANRQGCSFMYIQYDEQAKWEPGNEPNEYVLSGDISSLPYAAQDPDTYASRKRLMDEVGQLDGVDPGKPIILVTPYETYICNGE